jgi:hypothetical protein
VPGTLPRIEKPQSDGYRAKMYFPMILSHGYDALWHGIIPIAFQIKNVSPLSVNGHTHSFWSPRPSYSASRNFKTT